MYRIGLKTAIRSFFRKPLLPSLNLFGLSLGIACFLTISLYIYQENTYDTAFENHENIYRVEEHFLSMGQLAWTSPNMPFALDDMSMVAKHTRLSAYGGDFKVQVDDNTFKLADVLLVDEHFFDVFDFEFLQGNPQEALKGPGNAVISKATALKLFGTADVVGKSVDTDEFDQVNITAVVELGNVKSHLDFEMAFYQAKRKYRANAWYGVGGYSYVELTEGTSLEALNEALNEATKEKVFPIIYKKGLASDNPMTFDEWAASPNAVTFYAKPIRDIYLNSHLQFEMGPNGDKQTRVTLSIIGVFILMIAVINFMNLSTSRASSRAKEVGVKKVLGAGKKRLIRQFLVQSVLFTLLAAVIGGGLSELFIRIINMQLDQVITVSLMSQPVLVFTTLLGLVVLGLLAGAYPALYLSSVKSVPLLKGKSLSQSLNVRSAAGLRNGLVVFQFVISSVLIAASVVVFQQMTHLQKLDLGYDKANVIVIDNAYELEKNKEAFRNELLQSTNFEQASFTMRVPADGSNATLSTMLDSETTLSFGQFLADENLAQTLGITLIGGEWYSKQDEKNDSIVVVNESAVRAMGLEDPVGKQFGNYYRIKGVVKDFSFGGVREEIGPAVIFNTSKSYSRLAVRLNSDDYQLAELNEIWYKYTDEPIEVAYLDDKYEALIAKEKQASSGVLVCTIIAIVIAVLGLFGLATFSAEQRKHEFGIRRVLGARFSQILGLFGMHFIKLIMMAFVISIPIGYYGLNEWLNGFANRINISAPVFLIAGVLAIMIALLTLAFQSFKISRVNPVDTLQDQ